MIYPRPMEREMQEAWDKTMTAAYEEFTRAWTRLRQSFLQALGLRG